MHKMLRKYRQSLPSDSFTLIRLAASLLVLRCSVTGDSISGYYFDNGYEQTVLDTSLSLLEKEVMQEEILHLLGLHYRPHSDAPRRRMPDNSTVPTFMRDIYMSLLDETGDTGEIKNLTFQDLSSLQTSQFMIKDKDLKAINESDIIMSFVNYGHQEELEMTRRYWFDVSEVALNDKILSCELRIFKEARSGVARLRVAVYQLVDGSTGEDELLDDVVVSMDEEGWIILDVSTAFAFWQAFPKHNLGLLLKVISEDKEAEDISPHDLGLVGDRFAVSPRESFMVAFLKNSRRGDITLNRAKRSPEAKKKSKSSHHRKKNYSVIEQDFEYDNVYRDFYGGRHRRMGCQKRTLYVSFRDLGWQDWIIAPDGYSAYYCKGECSFPLNTHMNATNHAIVQTLVHLMTPFNVPKPCCAPTKLSGISVLYFDESSNVILKKYKNMVVKACGCH